MKVSGVAGSLRWGYLVAAGLTRGRGELGISGGDLVGELLEPDVYRLGQSPLTLAATFGGVAVRFPVEAITVAGASCTVRLGPRQA